MRRGLRTPERRARRPPFDHPQDPRRRLGLARPGWFALLARSPRGRSPGRTPRTRGGFSLHGARALRPRAGDGGNASAMGSRPPPLDLGDRLARARLRRRARPADNARTAGLAVMAFLVLVFPANVSAAARHVDFGGHGRGLPYLWIRAPLQLLLIAWASWFAVR